MMKNYKRWLALLLAIVMVATTGIFSSDGFLHATEGTEEQVVATSDEGAVQADVTEEIQVEAPAPEPEPAPQEPAPQSETPAPEEQPAAEEEVSNEVSVGQTVEVTPDDTKEDTYKVVFHRPAVEGGTLKVWTEGSAKKTVEYTYGKYTEEVKEGTTLFFEIKVKGNYSVDKVVDQRGTEIQTMSVNGNVSTYQMTINENKELTIYYKEATQKTEEQNQTDGQEAAKEEEASDDDEESDSAKEEVVASPAASKSQTVNGTTITVEAPEGALEEGWTLSVESVSKKSVEKAINDAVSKKDNIVGMKAFDITIIDRSGKEVQPDGVVNVTFSNTNFEGDVLEVYHVNDSKSKASKVSKASAGNAIGFSTEHFSIYVVVNGEEVYTSENDRVHVKIGESITIRSDEEWSKWTIESEGGNGTLTNNKEDSIKFKGTTPGDVKVIHSNKKGTKYEYFYITVDPKQEVNSISIDGPSHVLSTADGENEMQLIATTDPADVTGLKWNSSDTSVAKVDSNGKVTALSAGTVKITATVDGKTSNEYEITVTERYKITFDKNGGTGTTPDSIIEVENAIVTLPEQGDLSKENRVFVGWSTDSDATGSGKDHYTTPVYPAGSTYVVPGENVTLYAVWASENVDAEFYIRLDGTIPTEPQSHNSSHYGNAIKISGAIKIAEFYTNSSDGVADRLNTVPTDSQIQNSLVGKTVNGSPVTYDSSTQYILWYVIKHEAKWHVDGVLLNKSEVKLSYNANAPAGTWTNMPDGKSLVEGSTVYVGHDINDPSASKLMMPTRIGYTFDGWNTKADGTGTRYENDATFVIGREDVTLYAQWRPNASTAYTIEYYLQNEDGTYNGFASSTDTRYAATGQSVNAGSKTFTGYIYDQDNILNKQTGEVAADGSLVLKRYYLRDASKTKDTKYTVHYTIEGVEQTKDKLEVTGTVWVNDPAKIAIAEGGIPAPANKYTGYKLDSENPKYPEAGTKVDSGTEYTVNYVKDDSQTKPTSYTVEYYKDGAKVDADSYTKTSTAWINDETPEIAIQEKIDTANDKYVGYKLDSTEPATVPAKDAKVASGSVIKIYYIAEIYHLTIHYVYADGTTAAPDYTGDFKYQVMYGPIYSPTIDGYTPDIAFVSSDEDGMPAENVETTVTYTARTDIKYTVEYYYQNSKTGSYEKTNSVEREGTTDSTVAVTTGDKTPVGDAHYYFDSGVAGTKLEGTVTADGNLVLKVYFSLQYKVTGTIDNGGTVTKETQTVKYGADSEAMHFTAAGDYIIKSITVNGAAQKVEVDQTEYTYPAQKGVKRDITVEVKTEKVNKKLEVEKSVTNPKAENKPFSLGETIEYQVVVKNAGNVTLTDIKVTDTKVDLSALEGGNAIASLAPGASKTFTYSYKVTEADIESAGAKVVNTATATTSESIVGKDTVETEVDAPNPGLAVEKNVTNEPEDGVAFKRGEVIDYEVTVTNSGNVTLTNITVTDTKVALSALEGGNVIESLAPSVSKTFTYSYTVKEADVLKGKVVNKAVADPDDADYPNTPDTEDEITTNTEEPNGHLTVNKKTTSNPAEGNAYALGETITYEIQATNDGNITLKDVVVKDALTGDSWNVGELAPGQSSTVFEASHVVTEEDIKAGRVVNVATAEMTNPDPNPSEKPVEPGETTDVTETAKPGLSIVKTADGNPSQVKLGDTISYKIKVTNNGNVTIKDIEVTDDLTNSKWTLKSLAPGSEVSYPATYKVTEADILAGKVVNTATVTGKDPDGNDVKTKDDETVTTEAKSGKLVITKNTTSKAAENDKYALGETITYEIIAENTGNLTLTDVVVTDGLTDDEWTITSLAPGASKTFTAEYTVTENDILTGKVVNEATATATSPDKDKPEPEVVPGDTEDSTDPVNATYKVDKTIVNRKDEYNVGDTIQYEIVVESTANVTISDIKISDQLKNASGNVTFTDVTGATLNDDNTVTIDKLAPGAKVTLKCEYTVVREDAGKSIENTAIAKADTEIPDPADPENPINPVDPEDSTEPADVEDMYNLTIHYVYADGTTAAADVTGKYLAGEKYGPYNSPEIAGYTPDKTVVSSDEDGMPAENVETTVTYTARTDIKYTVEYYYQNSKTGSYEKTNSVEREGTTDSTVAVTTGDKTPVGDAHYYFDSGVAGTKLEGTVTADGNLVLKVYFSLQYKVTGTIDNGGTVTKETQTVKYGADSEAMHFTAAGDYIIKSITVNGAAQKVEVDQTEYTYPAQKGVKRDITVEVKTEKVNKKLEVEKSVTNPKAENKPFSLGETIEYQVVVKNAGNVTLTDIKVTDTKVDLSALEGGNAIASLAPGASKTFTYSYKVTEADIESAGAKVVNTATATTSESIVGKDTVETEVDAPNPGLAVEKNVTNEPEDGVAFKRGEVIDYEVTVTNSGNVTLTNITVTDTKVALSALEGGNVIESLAPSVSKTFTYSYTVKEADVLKGKVVNKAVADPDDADYPNTPDTEDEITTNTEEPNGHLTVNKKTTSNPAEGNAYALGETITYEIQATNDGNITLKDVVVKDALTGDSWNVGELAPGQSSTVFEASHVVTEEDIKAGRVVNVATAEMTNPDPNPSEKPVEPGETTDVTETAKPGLSIVKTADGNPSQVKLGDTISYKIKVTNNGNVTIKDIEVTDDLTNSKWTLKSLAPGSEVSYPATYKVTEADILAGKVVNTATVTGKDPDGNDVKTKDDETVTTEAKSGKLVITKNTTSKAAENDKYALGETITYEIIAENTGNLTLTDVVVTDGLTDDEWTITSLAPGASKTFTAEYTVTENDILTGKVVNEATATATSPDKDKPEPEVVPGDTEDSTDPVNATYKVDKTIVNRKDEYNVGDTIQYEIVVESTANVTISDIKISDQLKNASGNVTFTDVTGATLNDDNTVTIDKLAPGAKVTLKCEYTVVREDAGKSIENTAIAKADTEIPDPADPENPINPVDPEDSTEPADVEDMYNLTIHYVYADGTTAAADHTGEFLAGEMYGPIYSPTIDGYTPDIAFVISGEGGMPASDVELTVVYTANVAILPVTPPTDNNNPGGGTTAPQSQNTVTAEPTGAAIQAGENGEVDIVPVVDEKVPLARMDLEDHDCCILHFLLMLLALIVLMLYTRSMKKHQERIAELRDELETEQLKRELGLADKNENAN